MFSPWLVTVITALGTTAPEGSVTLPRIVPKMDCANPSGARHTAVTAILRARMKGLSLMVRLLVLRSQAWLLSRVQAVSETGFFRLLLHRCPQVRHVLSSPLFLHVLPSPDVPE